MTHDNFAEVIVFRHLSLIESRHRIDECMIVKQFGIGEKFSVMVSEGVRIVFRMGAARLTQAPLPR